MNRTRALALMLIGTLAAGGALAAAPAKSPPTKAPAAKPAPAAAKPAGGIGLGQSGDSNLPYDISSDDSENYQQERRAVWSGNVVVIQGDTRMNTPRLTVIFSPREAAGAKPAAGSPDIGKIERMDAEGPVYYTTPTQKAKGDHALYTAADDLIILTGNVVLVQNDKNVTVGDKLVIDRKNDHTTLSSNPRPADGTVPHQRVRAVIYPSNNTTAPANGTGPAAPKKSPGRP